jgi:hypothetical protein
VFENFLKGAHWWLPSKVGACFEVGLLIVTAGANSRKNCSKALF